MSPKPYEINISLWNALSGTVAQGPDQWQFAVSCVHTPSLLALEGCLPATYIVCSEPKMIWIGSNIRGTFDQSTDISWQEANWRMRWQTGTMPVSLKNYANCSRHSAAAESLSPQRDAVHDAHGRRLSCPSGVQSTDPDYEYLCPSQYQCRASECASRRTQSDRDRGGGRIWSADASTTIALATLTLSPIGLSG